jgi:hypothetical protein
MGKPLHKETSIVGLLDIVVYLHDNIHVNTVLSVNGPVGFLTFRGTVSRYAAPGALKKRRRIAW